MPPGSVIAARLASVPVLMPRKLVGAAMSETPERQHFADAADVAALEIVRDRVADVAERYRGAVVKQRHEWTVGEGKAGSRRHICHRGHRRQILHAAAPDIEGGELEIERLLDVGGRQVVFENSVVEEQERRAGGVGAAGAAV